MHPTYPADLTAAMQAELAALADIETTMRASDTGWRRGRVR